MSARPSLWRRSVTPGAEANTDGATHTAAGLQPARPGPRRQRADGHPKRHPSGIRTSLAGGVQVRWAHFCCCWACAGTRRGVRSPRRRRSGTRGARRAARFLRATSRTHTRPAAQVSFPLTTRTPLFTHQHPHPRDRHLTPRPATPGIPVPRPSRARRACARPRGSGTNGGTGTSVNILLLIPRGTMTSPQNLTSRPITQAAQAQAAGQEIRGAAAGPRGRASRAPTRGGDHAACAKRMLVAVF